MKDQPPIACALEVEITFYRDTLHRVDVGNLEKPVCDAMEGIVYEDDLQIEDLTLHKRLDRNSPRCEVRIRPKAEEAFSE